MSYRSRGQLPGTGADKPPGDGGGTEPERGWDRLGARLVVPTAQAEEDLPEEPEIPVAGLAELLVGGQGHLRVPRQIADAGHGERQLLIREVHRALLLAPAHQPGLPPGAGVARARELSDLLCQEVSDGLEAQGNEGLDEGHLGVEAIHLPVCPQPTEADVFHLAFALDAEYPLHGAAPFSVGLLGVWQQPLHHTGAASSIFN